jgi:membrane dipeptidase
MGTNKQYDGYTAYKYLDEPADHESVDLPDEMNVGGPPHEVALSDADAKRAEDLSAACTVLSLHEHPFKWVPEDPDELLDYCREGRPVTAYEYLARSNLDGVFDFHLDGVTRMHSKSGWKWSEIVHDLGMRACDIAHQDAVVRGTSIDDIRQAREDGTVALIPAVESSMMIENELDRIEILYGLGVRLMGISYNASNTLGTGLGDMHPTDGGLTGFGRDAVERMNEVGMAISVSHASDRTALDVCETSADPVFLTHDGARALNGRDRLKPDECLRAVADTGGVIGVQAAPHATFSAEHPEHTIESVMDHFEYLVDLVGIDHVTFGPDTLYGDHRALHKQFIPGVPDDAVEVDYVKGMENPTEAWHNIVRWLVEHEYSDDQIEKVLGGNTLRALEAVWP